MLVVNYVLQTVLLHHHHPRRHYLPLTGDKFHRCLPLLLLLAMPSVRYPAGTNFVPSTGTTWGTLHKVLQGQTDLILRTQDLVHQHHQSLQDLDQNLHSQLAQTVVSGMLMRIQHLLDLSTSEILTDTGPKHIRKESIMRNSRRLKIVN